MGRLTISASAHQLVEHGPHLVVGRHLRTNSERQKNANGASTNLSQLRTTAVTHKQRKWRRSNCVANSRMAANIKQGFLGTLKEDIM